MKAQARHLVSNIGHDTAKLAKRFGGETAALARRVGDGSVDIARRVGPKRAIIGAAVGAAVAGSIILVRYLKRRRETQVIDYDAIEQPGTDATIRAREASRERRESMRPMGH